MTLTGAGDDWRVAMKTPERKPLHIPVRALVVMDQPMLAQVVCLVLNHGVYISRIVRDGAAAAALMEEWHPDLAIVDLDATSSTMTGRLGFDRDRDVYVPVIALTRRGDMQSTLDAFRQGVDDILVTPFAPEELLARALVVTRRTYGDATALNPVIHVGALEIDILQRRVRVGSNELELTALEESLLYLLVANAGRALSREEILDNLWGFEYAPWSTAVDRLIRSLRAKLPDSARQFIETVPRKGYRFVPVASEDQQATAAV